MKNFDEVKMSQSHPNKGAGRIWKILERLKKFGKKNTEKPLKTMIFDEIK